MAIRKLITTAIDSLSLPNTTSSTSNATGALIVAGGAGIRGNLYATAVYAANYYYANSAPFVSGSSYTLPAATTSTLGGVIADGSTITVAANGRISASNTLPSQSGNSGKYLTTDGSTSSWSNVSALPSQSGNSGKYLTTDGTNSSWSNVTTLPSQSGNSGKYLTTDGTNSSWSNVSELPSQSGNSGKYLTTDGTNSSWSNVTTLPTQTANSGKFLTTNGTTASWVNVSVTPTAVSDQQNSSTGYFALPVGTTAQRGSPSAAGATRINSSTGYVEIYYNSVWNNAPINFAIGSTQANPGTSAAQIKTVSGTTTDGWYWINLPTVGSTYIYCDMNTNGGGWMLAAKLYSNANFNGYSSTDWTSISVFNELQTPTYAGNIKTNVYNYFTAVTGQRLSAGTVTNNLYEVWTGYSMYSLMNATSVNSQNSRTAWLNWQASAGSGIPVSNFDTQPNCNQAGTNKNYSHTVRIGISMNNENDCSSNDSSVGFGGSSVGYSGAASWTPSAVTNFTGWIWVK